MRVSSAVNPPGSSSEIYGCLTLSRLKSAPPSNYAAFAKLTPDTPK